MTDESRDGQLWGYKATFITVFQVITPVCGSGVSSHPKATRAVIAGKKQLNDSEELKLYIFEIKAKQESVI